LSDSVELKTYANDTYASCNPSNDGVTIPIQLNGHSQSAQASSLFKRSLNGNLLALHIRTSKPFQCGTFGHSCHLVFAPASSRYMNDFETAKLPYSVPAGNKRSDQSKTLRS